MVRWPGNGCRRIRATRAPKALRTGLKISDHFSSTSIFKPQVTYAERKLKGSTPQTIRTEFSYAAVSDYSENLKETREYTFAGVLRRKMTLAYILESNGGYVPLNITERVTTTIVYSLKLSRSFRLTLEPCSHWHESQRCRRDRLVEMQRQNRPRWF